MPVLTGGNELSGKLPLQAGSVAYGGFKVYKARYDFATHGGVVGAIVICNDFLPVGTFVYGGFMRVNTALTSSASGTMAISVQAANDLSTAAAVSGAPWSTVGIKVITPVFTVASGVLIATSAKQITATIGTGDLTAGQVDVYLFCVETA